MNELSTSSAQGDSSIASPPSTRGGWAKHLDGDSAPRLPTLSDTLSGARDTLNRLLEKESGIVVKPAMNGESLADKALFEWVASLYMAAETKDTSAKARKSSEDYRNVLWGQLSEAVKQHRFAREFDAGHTCMMPPMKHPMNWQDDVRTKILEPLERSVAASLGHGRDMARG